MGSIIDLERYPLDRLESSEGQTLVSRCREGPEPTSLRKVSASLIVIPLVKFVDRITKYPKQ
jgi:hypothetical protein